ncbi:MAG: flagellar motor protein MotA [Alphaproteobacteria bacterium]|nr:flagellar motor protein MotA [Alphaproteobacteria bacterium]
MTRPTVYMIRMGLFLGAVMVVAAALSFALLDAFRANVGLNGVILLVLLLGIIHSFRNVASLGREITWIESFRRDQAAVTSNISPRLLSPMATMLGERATGRFTLSTTAMRTLLDGIWSRLDERRELSRYIIGLLVFLGLLGTFWGLLETVRSIGGVIAGLSVGGGGDVSAVFEELKAGLQAPLSGMGTAFSSSLFGLAGSLVVGFLELQAGQAQNRFYNDLEEWLSGLTRLSSGGIGTEGDASVPAYIQALLEKTADSLERLERIMSQAEGTRDSTDLHLQQVADKLDKLGDSPALKNIDQTLTRMAQDTSQGRNQILEELRGEIRLLARTIAAAAGQSKQ